MKSTIAVLISILLSVSLIGCHGKNSSRTDDGGKKAAKWSKPHGILEGCDGVMSNSQQCANNPNNQQYMIEINRIGENKK